MNQEIKTPVEESKKMRQIIIETDGTEVNIPKAEVSQIELVAICNMIISHLSKKQES